MQTVELRMRLNAGLILLFTLRFLLQHVGHFFINPVAVDTQACEGKGFAGLTGSPSIR